jgi:Carboxypeptidase regulatory-like domain
MAVNVEDRGSFEVASICKLGRRLSLIASAMGFCVFALSAGLPVLAQPQQESPASAATTVTEQPQLPSPVSPACGVDQPAQQTNQQVAGSIRGTVIDMKGAGISGANVKLTRQDQSVSQEVTTGDDGQFAFENVAPGAFQLAITSTGFAAQTVPGKLGTGESCTVPQITLSMATYVTEVKVELTPVEIAQEQIQDQEKQRLFGVIPNFYVSYVHNAEPLAPKQKFQLALKSTIDPVSFGVTGVIAGVQQATDQFKGYGQGAQGYGKRYGASYADLVTGTFIGGAILPSLLKQDPRYFYKGTGSVRSRVLYAMANAVICKGDNGHWQPAYSGIIGSLAAGGISNLYYPEGDRGDAALTFENTLIGIGETAAVNVLQEFVMKKFTPNVPNYDPPTP